MKTVDTVTATDNTISIDDLARVTGGVTRGPNGEGCTDPRRPTGPRNPFDPSPRPMPFPRPPFGPRPEIMGGLGLGARAGAAVGGE